MSKIYDVNYMNKVMENYVPEGEVLHVAILGVGQEVKVIQTFKDYLYDADNNRLVRYTDEPVKALQVCKMKLCQYPLYLGITGYILT